MVSSLWLRSDGSWTRTPSKCVAESRFWPFRVIDCTDSAMRSMKVEAPSVAASNVTVVVLRNVVGPVVRSRATSYDATDSRSARSRASSRVRFLPGTGSPRRHSGRGVASSLHGRRTAGRATTPTSVGAMERLAGWAGDRHDEVPRRALVRPAVPLGVDDLPLADGGREGPRRP